MIGPAMTLAELVEGLRVLNAPNQGLSYHAGGFRRGSPKYDEYTGERLTPRYDAAELNVYGGRARFLHRLIENGEQLAAALSSGSPPLSPSESECRDGQYVDEPNPPAQEDGHE